ncbi:MAG: hypothetical protein HYW47_05495, partial [Deltaproteobacteria bacterium]|nr:hypothetical protein [Deltaproteobacteria bacterium]
WDMVPFDVQLIGGIALHEGKIAEMKTGEGKTLVCTLPVYLNALEGKGVHVVTVNDYLANRDAEWMGGLYHFLGLTVGVNIHGLNRAEKNAAYKASHFCEVRMLLVLDATMGQNALKQVEEFGKVVPISGIIMTKLDGSAKGGILLPIVDQYHLPVYFIGTGETLNDFSQFDPQIYVSEILN